MKTERVAKEDIFKYMYDNRDELCPGYRNFNIKKVCVQLFPLKF